MSTSLTHSFIYFILVCLFLSKSLFVPSAMVSLLVLLVYFGSLIILFAYIWIYIPYTVIFPSPLIVLFLLILLFSPLTFTISSTLIWYHTSTAFLLLLSLVLFWAIVVVVHILDLSLGAFTS